MHTACRRNKWHLHGRRQCIHQRRQPASGARSVLAVGVAIKHQVDQRRRQRRQARGSIARLATQQAAQGGQAASAQEACLPGVHSTEMKVLLETTSSNAALKQPS
jgi:hypothetical protein